MKAICRSSWRALPPRMSILSRVTSISPQSSSLGCWHSWDLIWSRVHLLLVSLFNLDVLRPRLPEPQQFQDMNYGDSLCFWEFGGPIKPLVSQYIEKSCSPHSTGCSPGDTGFLPQELTSQLERDHIAPLDEPKTPGIIS